MKPGAGWPIGLALILATTVIGNLSVIYFTGDDPSFAVEPDYYRKAVVWDSTQLLNADSKALGWHATVQLEAWDGATTDGETALRLTLRDADGHDVPDAEISGELLHIARASVVDTLHFAPSDSGTYLARARMARAGLWELRLAAERHEPGQPVQYFLHTLRLETVR